MTSYTVFKSPWLLGGWIAAVALVMVASIVMGANPSMTAQLVALGVAPALVVAFLANQAASPTVAEILHSVDTKDGRA